MILWVRHGQSTWNVLDRMQGQTAHPPLTDLGREQASRAAETLATRGVTRIVSSPAVRALQSAGIIADRLGLEIEIEPLITEQGLEESIESVLGRIQTFLAKIGPVSDPDDTVVAVSHGDTIGLAVGMLAGQRPTLPENCSITIVDPQTHSVEVIRTAD
ncbi:MAG: histidine phosphatase family protein [Aeromicrobium sp.]